MNLTYENHFKFGYDKDWFRLRQNNNETFMIEYGRCDKHPKDFRSESIRAAELIQEYADDPIHVLYSGGVDSEVTMLSFIAANIPIKAAIMRFNNNLNQHDIFYAIRFCERNQISYKIYDLNISKFLENQVLDYMEPIKCTSPMTAATMWLIDQIDGFPILGQGECYLQRPKIILPTRVKEARVTSYKNFEFTENDWALQESEMMNGWYRHFLLRERNGVPGFHQYCPEQILSYIIDSNVIKMMKQPKIYSSEFKKLSIYQRHFDLPPRIKYTGYENVSYLIDKAHKYLLEKYSSAQNIYLIDYETLKSKLQPLEIKT